MKRIPLLLGIVGASVLAGGITAYTVTRLTAQDTPTRVIEFASQKAGSHFTAYEKENYPDLTYAAENAVKAVVNIEKIEEVEASRFGGGRMDPFFEFFGIPQGYQQQEAPQERRSGGSGVIISPDGYIVTNNHVIENASKLKVKLNDNRTFEAKLIGTDPTTDVALIKIEAEDLPTLAFGNSDDLRLGEWVLAIGSPFDLQSTVTAGIVSAKARNLDVIPNQFRIESFIQTDAAVNPGNSGGALVDTKGELMGINTVIKSPTGSYTGYSFAVPSSIVKKVVVDLKEFGVVQRALLGVQFQEINEAFVEHLGDKYGIKEIGGVYVAEVDPAGAAAAAGIKKGDVITEIDGLKITGSAPLLEAVAKHRPNDKVKITVKRDGNVKQFDVVLRNKAGKAELLAKDYVDSFEALGGKFAEIDNKTKKELRISGGVRVVSIDENGILSKARIRKGYVITHINDRPVNSISDLSRISEKITSIDGVYPDGRSASYALIQ
ncbi:Do family serine endopeptidase [Gallalistipes aquisgranensis]|uniref:Do family serine endopeptidase n=1 Tax=Gallalistipes aquisgranensis TaxID=2779358 RepID=UPI001CF8743A|nr:Do family serine endopeptidase [Gallalistipes aquisgranensis]MBE5032382.1 Do family serine endopeptidase [Gallalistipes aquisgranensis]